MRTPLPPFQYIRKRGLQLQSSTGYSRVSIQSWDRCSSDGASGNLVHSNCDLAGDSSCCSTNRYSGVPRGGPWVPLNPLFWWTAFENTMRKRALALLWHDHAYKTYRSNSCNNVSYSFSVPRMVQFSKVAWQHTHTHMRWWASLFFAKRVAWKSLRSC